MNLMNIQVKTIATQHFMLGFHMLRLRRVATR
jgi:hypothetical protein